MSEILRTLLMLVFLQTFSVMSQESYMQWQNGDKHVLGVIQVVMPVETLEKKPPQYYKKYLQARNSINDTFFFRNMSDQPLVIRKIHVQDSTLYTYTRTTAPGRIGYVVYHANINAHTNGIVNVVVRFNVMTNFSPWVMCETNYILVGNYNVSCVENKEAYNIVYTEKIDSFVSRQLVCDLKNAPRSLGLVHARTGTKMHTWNYWDAVGRMPDTIFTKSAYVYVRDDYNCSRYQLNILVKQNGVWQKAIYRPAGNQYQVLVDEFSDSLFLFNDTVYTKLDVRYQKSAETIHYYAVNVIRYSDNFLAYHWNMEGFQFVSDQYAIIFKADLDRAISLDEERERLKASYPLLDFEILNDQLLVVSLPKKRYWVDSHYINKLLKDNSVDYISQMLHSPQYGYTFLRNTITIKGIIMERAVASDSVLSACGYELSKKYPEIGWVELKYKNRLINRDFCQQFNSLGEQKLFEDRVPNFFSYRRPRSYEYDYIKE